ncbi:MAG: hypothetical protein JXL84_11340 [Deltaproteobacteria bacterium]|nr:hypothetical protein [Deltaproteobacteria bacterium]
MDSEREGEGRVSMLREGRPGSAALQREVRGIVPLSGRDAVNTILDLDRPEEFVRSMARTDFYWLVKKVGEDDALPLLQLASPEQWEHLLDMEIWERDRLSHSQASYWLERLLKASPTRVVRWFYAEGEEFCFHYMSQSIQVEVRREDEALDLPDGFFTLDNRYYFRILDKEHEEMIGDLLRRMAQEDHERYQAVLLGQVGVLPAEMEEEMYRVRNMRLAEDGFLPHEEAISLYAYLRGDALTKGSSSDVPELPLRIDAESVIPVIPLLHVRGQHLLAEVSREVSDPLFLDRLRLEFAGLCNQMLSADMIRVSDAETLVRTCRRAAGYVGLGLESLSGGDVPSAERFLRDHPLVSIFRVGFGLTMELKWETERWVKEAWYSRMGLGFDFWGEAWGRTLEGVLLKRPLQQGGARGEEPRPFEHLSEIEECRAVLRQVFVMDRVCDSLTSSHLIDRRLLRDPLLTFHGLLFTFWARLRLNLAPGFEPVSLDDLKVLFHHLRGREKGPPFTMKGFKKGFVQDFMKRGAGLAQVERSVLRGVLSRLWDEFRDEHAWVALPDLDGRFSRFVVIK